MARPFWLLLLPLLLPACTEQDSGPRPIGAPHAYVPVPAHTIQPTDIKERFGLRPMGPVRGADAAPTSGLTWTTPAGWQELPPQQFRDANFAIPSQPDVECYLTLLPGAGSMLDQNVNRWRGQFGQPPLSPQEIEALPKKRLLGTDGVAVDLTGSFKGAGANGSQDGWRLIGVVADAQGDGVTLKMTGPATAVAALEPAFESLCASFQRGGSGSGSSPAMANAGSDPHAGTMGGGAMTPPAATSAPLAWTPPDGWTEDPPSDMRLVTFHPGGRDDTECALFLFPGDAGGEVPNIQRWVGQMGQPVPSAAQVAAMPTVEIAGHQARMVHAEGTYAGMGGESHADYGLLGAVCDLGGQTLFVKMTGPKDVVTAETDHFRQLCRSLTEQ